MKQSEINAVLKRGIGYQQARDFITAERHYQTVLREHPDDPDASNLLGTLALEAKRVDVAITLFNKALAQRRHHPGYLTNLGNALLQAKRQADAAIAFESAIRAQPGLADALLGASQAYRALNRTDDAMALAKRAMRSSPANSRVIMNLAGLHISAGDTKLGVDLLRPLIRRKDPVPNAVSAMATAHKFTPDDPEPDIIARLADSEGLSDETRANVLHALGKARADLKQHDEAFAAYQRGKQILGRSFDFPQLEAYYEALITNLDPAFYSERQGFGIAEVEPVFVVGMPRSGTTLTEQICASHSDVTGVGEVPSMGKLANAMGWRKGRPDELLANLRALTREQSVQLAQSYLDDVAQYGGTGKRVVDKMPHNYEFLGLIALLFPRAHIIHCTRDPIDNCVSCFTHNFNENHAYNADLDVLGRYYRMYRRLMAHWKSALPLAILDNSYEAMVADQETQSRRLIAFLGLEWEDAVLEYYDNDRLVKTPSRWQVRQPIYSSSVKAWKKYEAHLGPLFDALGDLAVRD